MSDEETWLDALANLDRVNSNADGKPGSVAERDGDRDAVGHVQRDRDGHTHCDRDGHSHGYVVGHTYCDRDHHADGYAPRDCDRHADSHTDQHGDTGSASQHGDGDSGADE